MSEYRSGHIMECFRCGRFTTCRPSGHKLGFYHCKECEKDSRQIEIAVVRGTRQFLKRGKK